MEQKSTHKSQVGPFGWDHSDGSVHTDLVMPKSDTFTSLFSETRQFLAACRHRGRQLSGDERATWCEAKPSSVGLPGLCGGSWSSPGRSSLRWRLHTCSTTSSETDCLSWLAGSWRDSHSPWTQRPGTGENAACTRRRAEPTCGARASCQVKRCAELSHRPNVIGMMQCNLHHNSGLLLQFVFWHAPFSDHFHRHLLPLPSAFQHEAELTAAYLLTQGQVLGVQFPLICNTEARWW